MKRSEHLFQFTGAQISKAALAEKEYHLSRLNFWRDEHEKALARAKGASVEIREYNVTGGKRADVVIDPTLANRLDECSSKMNSHRAAADRFDIEATAYGTQGDRSYELQADDVIYFRLGGGTRES